MILEEEIPAFLRPSI